MILVAGGAGLIGSHLSPPRQRGPVYDRLRMRAVDGTWERVLTPLMAQADADEDVN